MKPFERHSLVLVPFPFTDRATQKRRQPIGNVISELLRRALTTPGPADPGSPPPEQRNGFPLLPLQPSGGPVDLELVNSLREDGE